MTRIHVYHNHIFADLSTASQARATGYQQQHDSRNTTKVKQPRTPNTHTPLTHIPRGDKGKIRTHINIAQQNKAQIQKPHKNVSNNKRIQQQQINLPTTDNSQSHRVLQVHFTSAKSLT